MYKDLISNIAIMISCLAVTGQLTRIKPMDTSIMTKIVGGIAAGLLGSLLMLFSVKIENNVIIDFRNLAVIIATLYGGLPSGLAAGALIICNRFAFFGVNPSSLTASFVIIVIILLTSYLKKSKATLFTKFLLANLCNVLLFAIAITFLVKNADLRMSLLLYYGVFSLVGGCLSAWVCDFINRSNENYRKLKVSATKDFLTGLNNVRQFDETWNNKVSSAIQTGEPLSLLVIDIDYFKLINDKYGHPDGDRILKQLGELLADAAGNTGIAARNGGEEFSIILPGMTKTGAKAVAETVRKRVQEHAFSLSGDKEINITVSVGVASYPETTNEIGQLIKQADECLYRAKNLGRNRVCAEAV
ncbi:GGDEF domain-containing protein [Neobacillus sp. SCS-31]|uniref:GGDEF domain-containing protein n=1 Tax=Neobacillus oceani TaxID=3115292 RepID=UPI0039068070